MNQLTITVDDLLSWKPCRDHDKIRRIMAAKERWSVMDILAMDQPAVDLLWVILCPELIPERTLYLLGCDYVEHVLPIWESKYPDDRTPHALIVAQRAWIARKISDGELKTAIAAADTARMVRSTAAMDAEAAGWVAEAAMSAAAAEAEWAAAASRAAARVATGAAAEGRWQLQHTIQVLEAEEADNGCSDTNGAG